jgi:hypothetical protein
MSAHRWGLERLTVEVLCPLAAPDSPVCSDFAVLTSEFLIPFSFYFLYGIQIKSNHNSNSNISHMCINEKQSLSSA